jgi:CRISPR-associated protein Cas2
MWMMVMFDLTVVQKDERAEASAFRLALLDQRFEMEQFSVYVRFCTSQAELDTYTKRLADVLSAGGKVDILTFTDKQYGRIESYVGRTKQLARKAPDQFTLF